MKKIEDAKNENLMCSCGKSLVPVYNNEGKRIGLTHDTAEDEDWHNEYWSTKKVLERIKSN